MALDFSSLLNAVVSHAKTLGVFENVMTHEPKAKPGTGISATVWLNSITPAKSGVRSTSLRVELSVRVYMTMLTDPEDDIDLTLVSAVSALMDAYSGDFELGGLVRSVDLLGASGTALSVNAGYLSQDGTVFRVLTVTLPLIVNDVHDQVA